MDLFTWPLPFESVSVPEAIAAILYLNLYSMLSLGPSDHCLPLSLQVLG